MSGSTGTSSAQEPVASPPLFSHARLAMLSLCLAVIFVQFLSMPRQIYVGDAESIRNATINLLTTGKISVSAKLATSFQTARGQYYFENEQTGLWYPKFGILNTFLYAPPLFIEKQISGELLPLEQLDRMAYARRCLLLNAYNGLLTLMLAVLLFRTAALYLQRPWMNALFVMSILFGTFTWNYLRAQTVEIFQVVFFCGCYYHLICYRRMCMVRGKTDDGVLQDCRSSGTTIAHLCLTLFFAALLSLEKLAFCPLTAVVALWLLMSDCDLSGTNSRWMCLLSKFRTPARSHLIIIVAAVAVTSAIVLMTNWYRFGSPFSSGYGQWQAEKNFLSGNAALGIWGFMVDPQKSVFLYFPHLLFAFLAFPSFLRKHAWEGSFILFVALSYLLLNSQFVNWRGDWAFGPRYLLFVLPILSLPMLKYFDRTDEQRHTPHRVVRFCLLTACFWIFMMQYSVHRLESFAPFRAEATLVGFDNQEVNAYFRKPHWIISRDLCAFARGRGSFPPLEQLNGRISPTDYQLLSAELKKLARGNFYLLDNPLFPF